ncbi:MAG: alpha/beta hydrolase [Deltaproteobacteria bacterium]|nr:alpha/beta hydrolase [Deltaproteobacteria bacterium]
MRHEEVKAFLPTYNLNLAMKHWWTSPSDEPVLALHGWLDNAASFDVLANKLKDRQVYALDFAGHGFSDHFPPGFYYSQTSLVEHLVELLDVLKWDSVHLLGHSMGACVATLFAGLLPERVKSLVLIEGLGPFSADDEKMPERFREYLPTFKKRSQTTPRVHPSFEEAARVRAQDSEFSKLTIEAARLLASRGTKKVNGGFSWNSDPRLLIQTPHPFTEKQVRAFLRNIICPTIVIWAEEGLAIDPVMWDERLLQIPNHKAVHVHGSHHCHMENAELVALPINKFYSNLGNA